MGWCSDDGTHEGYLVGLVFDDAGWFLGHARDRGGVTRRAGNGRMRELGTHADGERRCTVIGPDGLDYGVLQDGKVPLEYVKIGCSCGWRSPIVRAWGGTYWAPCMVFTSDTFEERAALLWQAHVRETGPMKYGVLSVEDLPSLNRR